MKTSKHKNVEELIRKIRQVRKGQTLTIRFKDTGIEGLSCLKGLLDRGGVHLADERAVTRIDMVLESGAWGNDRRNRVYALYGLQSVGLRLLEKLTKHIETVNVTSDDPSVGNKEHVSSKIPTLRLEQNR